MTREALFSILQRWPDGAFLDLFAGTGAVGLEAWSRGYAPVTAVERPGRGLDILKANARGTDLSWVAKDVTRLKAEAFRGLAVVFADPPYPQAVELWLRMAPVIHTWMDAQGVVVWETERRTPPPDVEGFERVDSRTYGRALLSFFEPR